MYNCVEDSKKFQTSDWLYVRFASENNVYDLIFAFLKIFVGKVDSRRWTKRRIKCDELFCLSWFCVYNIDQFDLGEQFSLEKKFLGDIFDKLHGLSMVLKLLAFFKFESWLVRLLFLYYGFAKIGNLILIIMFVERVWTLDRKKMIAVNLLLNLLKRPSSLLSKKKWYLPNKQNLSSDSM